MQDNSQPAHPDAPSGAAPSRRAGRHLVYAVVLATLALLAGYRGVLPVFRSHLMAYLGIGDDRLGLLFSVGPLAGLCSVLFGGQGIDRWGPRRVIRVCLLGVGAAMCVIACAGSRFGAFLLGVGAAGFFAAPLFIAINAYLGKLFPGHKRRALSLNLASTSLGGMMFPLVAEALLLLAVTSPSVSFAFVLHAPFLLCGAGLMGASFIYRQGGAPASRAGAYAPSESAPWRWRDLLLPGPALFLAILISAHGAADSILLAWMARFLESGSFERQLLAPGLVLSGYSLAYLLSRALLAALPDRVGRRAFMVLPGLAGGAVLVAGILSRDFRFTALAYVAGAFCWSAEFPALASVLMHEYPRRFGAAMAVSQIVMGLLVFCAMNGVGILVARLGDAHMWKLMLLPACGFPLVGLGALAWLAVFDRHSSATKEEQHHGR